MECFNCSPNNQCNIFDYYDNPEDACNDIQGCQYDGLCVDPENCECFEEDV